MGAAVAELGQFGVDGAEAGIGPAVFGVPLWALVDLGAEFVEVALATGDGGFGLSDVSVEAVNPVEDRGFLFAAVAAELGEGAEIGEPFLGGLEAVVGPVEVLLG